MSPRCVRCGAEKADHADIDPATAPEGICPRFEAPAPRWLTVVSRAVEKLTGEPQ